MDPIPWRDIDAVVFDLDGTLYDHAGLKRRMAVTLGLHLLRRPGDLATVRLLARFRRLREELAEAGVEGIREEQYRRAAEGSGSTPEEVAAAVERWMHRRPLPLLPRYRFPGVDRLFALLRASGRRVGVLSDYPVDAKLAALGLAADATLAAEDPAVDRLKPDPAGLLAILRRLGVEPGRALMVGDRDERDGEAARRAGVDWRLKVPRPDGGPRTFAEYRELVESLEAVAAP